MKEQTQDLWLEINGIEIHVDVGFTYTPADPGKYTGPMEGCYPAEPSEIEIYSMALITDTNIRYDIDNLLNDTKFCDSIEEAIMESLEDE